MHESQQPYYMFTSRSRIEKSVNLLLGLIVGLAIDSRTNDNEVHFLNLWLEDHRDVQSRHPFNEIVPVVLKSRYLQLPLNCSSS